VWFVREKSKLVISVRKTKIMELQKKGTVLNVADPYGKSQGKLVVLLLDT
jgi:hypothetical protein